MNKAERHRRAKPLLVSCVNASLAAGNIARQKAGWNDFEIPDLKQINWHCCPKVDRRYDYPQGGAPPWNRS